jgi:hypothetical protein
MHSPLIDRAKKKKILSTLRIMVILIHCVWPGIVVADLSVLASGTGFVLSVGDP